MALASTLTDDWSGGIYRGKRAPANAVYDATNALVNDEGFLFRRGGSAFRSNTNAGAALIGLADVSLPLGPATLVWSSSKMYTLSHTDDATPSSDLVAGFGGGATAPRAFTRGAGVGNAWYIPTAATTSNQLLKVFKNPATQDAEIEALVTTPSSAVSYVTAVGGPRLIATYQNRAYFSGAGTPDTFTSGDYHELPQNAQIIGADSIGDTLVLFTTAGVWVVENMALDSVDDFGNIQHQVNQVSKDLILWGDPGVAAWQGGLVVPAIDDVFLFSPGSAPQPITGARGSAFDGGIRDLYRGYVRSGYAPGLATVFRGHLLLPVLNGTSWVDTLVCRLDHGLAWTRWDGHAASTAFAVRVGQSTRTPKLLGIASQRVTDLTDCFAPSASNSQDADGTSHACTTITRDLPTGTQPSFVQRARLTYELTGDGAHTAPTVALAYSSDQDAGSFTTLTENGLQNGGTAGAVSDGSKYSWWLVAKRRPKIRFRITMSGAAATFVLRSIEMLTRPQGRQ